MQPEELKVVGSTLIKNSINYNAHVDPTTLIN